MDGGGRGGGLHGGLAFGGCASSGDGMMKKDDGIKKDDEMTDKK
jgi:hypothetical protein